MIYLAVTYFIGAAHAGDVEVTTYAESIVIEDGRAEAVTGRATYGPYEVEFETLSGEVASESLEVTGVTVTAEGWGWRLWSDSLAIEGGEFSGSDVVVSRCVADWRPWELRAERASLANSRVELERPSLSIMELIEVPIPIKSISLTPSSWSLGIPSYDWVNESLRLSVPLWFRIDEVRSAKVALGWWQGARLSGELIDRDNGVLGVDLAHRDSELQGYFSADYAAGDRQLGVVGEGALLFGGADLSWFDEYELRSREFLQHRVMLVSHGLSFERMGWILGDERSAVHAIAFTGDSLVGNRGFERHRVRLYNDGEQMGADGLLAMSSTQRLGFLELDGELAGYGEIDSLGRGDELTGEVDGNVTVSVPVWARHGDIVHEAAFGVRVGSDSSIAPSFNSRFYGKGTQSVDIWAPITPDGFDLAGAMSHRSGSWFVDLVGEYTDNALSTGGAVGFNNDSFELSMNGWLDDTTAVVIGTTAMFIPVAHGRWRPSVSSIVSDKGLLFVETGIGWIADCGCLDAEISVSVAEDRRMPIVSGVLQLGSAY